MENKVSLKELLWDAEAFPWNEHLYMRRGEEWSLASDCFLFDLDDLADDEDDPQTAEENGLECVLSVADVQDIAANLREQNRNCTAEELFAAFVFYYENDAFFEYDS